jgi:hypothetical protein
LVQTDQFWFSFLGQKPVWLDFFVLARFFPVWFFRFHTYKTKTEPNRSVFKNFNRFNRFFFTVRFFQIFFFNFLCSISFLIFLLTPALCHCLHPNFFNEIIFVF